MSKYKVEKPRIKLKKYSLYLGFIYVMGNVLSTNQNVISKLER